ncbi:hypothetical protein EC991_000385 [Linnemannia zychae]|nr:hypothetical protein EC991_000385 [Linnemannia zychae]
MVRLLEWYFPRLRHLHLDGVPAGLLIEITTGPIVLRPNKQHYQQSRYMKDYQAILASRSEISEEILEDAMTTDATVGAANLSWLEIVLTHENLTAQQVLEYRLVPLLNKKSQTDNMVEHLEMKTHSVLYSIANKNWQRIVS